MGDKDANKALLLAAEHGEIDPVKAAIAAGADLCARDDLNNTALCTAASAGHLEVVKLLIENGADIHITGYCDMAALTLAARDGRIDVVRYLLAHGAASSERVVNDAIQVGSMSAYGRPEIVDLLREARLNIVSPVPRGMADADARMIQAAGSGDANGVEAAIRDGADVAAQDDRGMDALSWAALRGHDAVVRVLIDHGANINALNSSGWPAIGQACGQGRLEVVKALVARGVDVNLVFDGGRTALMCAAFQGHAAIVKELLQAGADTSRIFQGKTARDLAAQRGNIDIIEILKGSPDME